MPAGNNWFESEFRAQFDKQSAAIGRFTFHNREYLVAIKAYEKVLALHTMRFADELVTRRDLEAPRLAGRPEAKEVRMAEQLVEALTEDFKPGRLHDEYRETVLAAIRDKARGKEIDIPEAEPDAESDDLAAALEASLPKRKRARTKAAA